MVNFPGQKNTQTLEDILAEAQASSISAKRTTIYSFMLVGISTIAAVASAYYALKDSTDDEAWRNEQTKLLKEISTKLDTTNTSTKDDIIIKPINNP